MISSFIGIMCIHDLYTYFECDKNIHIKPKVMYKDRGSSNYILIYMVGSHKYCFLFLFVFDFLFLFLYFWYNPSHCIYILVYLKLRLKLDAPISWCHTLHQKYVHNFDCLLNFVVVRNTQKTCALSNFVKIKSFELYFNLNKFMNL